MKKGLKRFSAIALTFLMALAMNSTVFAADPANMTGEGGKIGEFTAKDTPTEFEKSITLYKEITAYNPETCTVNAPTITYKYEVAAGDAGKSITDASSHHNKINNADVNVTVTTKAGVGTPAITCTTATGATTDGNLNITPADQLKSSVNGTANRFPIVIDFSGIDYKTDGSGAGVYRYVITETCTVETKNAAGIADGSIANTLYMDVYVDGDGKVYGYVLFTNNSDIDASPDNDTDADSAAGKTEGFVGSKPNEGEYSATETSAADKYYTFNLDLKKVVDKDAYATSTKHKFPFTVTLTNGSVTAAVLPIMTINDNTLAEQTDLTAGAIAGTWSPKIADGGQISYVGIPCGTTIAVYETNDVAGVTYNAAPTNADAAVDAKSIDTNDVSNTATISCGATALTAATENHTASGAGVLTFTNTLLQISPTGFVVRFAPYMLILLGGALLIGFGIAVYNRTNKKEA